MRGGTRGSAMCAASSRMVFKTVLVLIESTRAMSRMPLEFIVIGTIRARMAGWQPRYVYCVMN
jgi:hypothetical protein